MLVVYTQERTVIVEEGDESRNQLKGIYGDKLGGEAYRVLNKAPVGSSYRKNGGPLIQVVTKELAEIIRERERAIGMME